VIREEEEFPLRAPRQSQRPAHDQRPQPEPPRSQPPRPEPSRPEPPRPEPPRPEPLAGPAVSGEPEIAETAVPYGPDDPAYGPPSADWYARQEQEEQELEVAEEAGEPEEPQHVRGPFEPPQHSAEQAALYRVLADESPRDGGLGGHDGSLGRLKDLYQTAEAAGADSLDKHFEELLERQRQLIREYFSGFGGRRQPGPGAGQAGQAGQAGETGRMTFGADRSGPR
jgi:hypothetical protein